MKNDEKKYLYIGKFFHRKDKDLGLLEKKIGITGNLNQREYELGRTKSPIGYTILAAWDAGDDAKKVEKKIHVLLGHNQSYGEWFEDDDNDLLARVTEFMELSEYPKKNLGKGKDKDADEARNAETNNVEMRELRSQHIDWLLDIPLNVNRYGEDITITMTADGKFYCEQTQKTYTSTLHGAFQNAGKELTGREKYTINVWTGVRDDDGRTPDEILKIKAKEGQEQ